MLTKERIKTISKLAFPVGIALSSALAMSLIDLAMVGSLGNHVIAAVGLSVFSHSIVLAVVTGISPAVQGMVARRRGQNSKDPKCLPLNAGLVAALIVGIPLTILCYTFAPFMFSLVSSDPEVTRVGVPFLRMLYLSILGNALNSAFRGHWYGMEKTNITMINVVFMNCLNVLGNFVFIYGLLGFPALGSTGAALSTTVAIYVGTLVNFVLVFRKFPGEGFLRTRPKRATLAHIFKVGIPATMQEFFFALGYIVFFWLIGQIGTAELAAANVLVRIGMVLLLLAMSLGTASATLVSKAIGEGDPADAAQWGWDAGKLGVICITALGVPLFLFPEWFLKLFLTNPHTIEMAIIPLRMVAATAGLGSLIYIFAYTLVSVGDGKRVVMISFGTQWLLFLPAVWLVGLHLHYGLLQIWMVQMVYGLVATLLITAVWAGGRWKNINI